jgi:hypothetical protein
LKAFEHREKVITFIFSTLTASFGKILAGGPAYA